MLTFLPGAKAPSRLKDVSLMGLGGRVPYGTSQLRGPGAKAPSRPKDVSLMGLGDGNRCPLWD
jgi:hypothetical protein